MGWPFHGQALMLEVIQNLLVLQDCDRKLLQLQDELAHIAPQRERLAGQAQGAQARLDHARQQLKGLETQRKELELEVEAIKQRIERYALQQFQTKKNEEYRALAHEIQIAKDTIVKLEDRELEVMEQAEAAQKEVHAASQTQVEAQRESSKHQADLASREQDLREELAKIEADRERLTAGLSPELLHRYERLRKSKGEKVVVGVAHGVCGGCHMRLPAQILVSCQAEQEMVVCPNCGRLLYYTRDMSLAVAD